jgi:hypothetical protein
MCVVLILMPVLFCWQQKGMDPLDSGLGDLVGGMMTSAKAKT